MLTNHTPLLSLSVALAAQLFLLQGVEAQTEKTSDVEQTEETPKDEEPTTTKILSADEKKKLSEQETLAVFCSDDANKTEAKCIKLSSNE